MIEPYKVFLPQKTIVPIVVSVPHCGTLFPDHLKSQYDGNLIEKPDDTDWYVDKLYDFAPSMGITMITAVYSRWVVDLNRDPEQKPLYSDGRIITELCPVTDFLGRDLYRDHRRHMEKDERNERLNQYFFPYHQKLHELIVSMKEKFGNVLLWDCHSIRQSVPTIRSEKFPDLILGSADMKSASEILITEALKNLAEDGYSLNHNDPFKGGYITRNYGKPADGVHALQLEMTKVNYMNDDEKSYDEPRALRMRKLLQNTLSRLSEIISS
jgi:N-formylglutamate deformylase